MRFLIIATVVCLLGAGVVVAQEQMTENQQSTSMVPSEVAQASGIGIQPATTPFSLLDLSRVKWSHSYSVSFFSGGGTSSSVGQLNTTMFYEFSSKLHLTLNLGLLHNTAALWGDENYDATFLPGFRLDYQPSDNVFMTVQFQTYSSRQYPYLWGHGYRYYDPLYMGR